MSLTPGNTRYAINETFDTENTGAFTGTADGALVARTADAAGTITIEDDADYKTGQWYTARNVVNLDAGTFDFYIDNMATPVLTNQPLRTLVDDLAYFSFFINSSNTGNLLVDYVRVNTGTPFDYNDASLGSVTAKRTTAASSSQPRRTDSRTPAQWTPTQAR